MPFPLLCCAERTLLLQMLQAAQGDSEEVQMSKVRDLNHINCSVMSF